ncbi:hypothetical protein DH2020_043827 [Rehmannia glutinosa]|uniref:PHD finger protein n=1 Tax=Rehmannia glutinosa TaxID=99300 RepID=A0ABR0UJ08_REHGL
MASIVFHRPSNKRKNRVNSDKLFDFGNFAIPESMNTTLSGAFRDNIRNFLQNFAEIEEYTVHEKPVWNTSLFSEKEGVFSLYTVEETVENSIDPFCDLCELSGWGHHFVCKRKYYFIIPAKNDWNTPLDEDFALYDSHYLYGLIHCNGYGHLICINGLKNNSNLFTADDSMELWERLCTLLKARSIAAHCFSRTEAIDRILIYGAAYGKSWFEKWGYKFSSGSPGTTEHKYNAEIRSLSSLSLDKLISDFKKKKSTIRVQEMIEMYRKLSETPLVTISDLFKFVLVFQSRIRTDNSNGCMFNSETGECPMGFQTFVNSMTKDCRWSAKRLENVLFVIIDQLKEHKPNGMSRQELRDESRKCIGDTGLIDFVLKSIKCFAVDNQIIRRSVNPLSRLTEFTICEISSIGPGLNLTKDLQFLTKNVLAAGYSETQVILASNHFVKEWPVVTGKIVDQSMKLICKVLPSFDEMETELKRRLSPGEVVVVEPWITIADLKMVAQCALRDTYCIMDEFEVDQIGGLRKIEDEKVLFSVLEPGAQVWVRGHGLDLHTELRYEDGGRKTSTVSNGGGGQ